MVLGQFPSMSHNVEKTWKSLFYECQTFMLVLTHEEGAKRNCQELTIGFTIPNQRSKLVQLRLDFLRQLQPKLHQLPNVHERYHIGDILLGGHAMLSEEATLKELPALSVCMIFSLCSQELKFFHYFCCKSLLYFTLKFE